MSETPISPLRQRMHLLEQGTDIHVMQALLGHASATARYTKVSTHLIAATRSPLDWLELKGSPAP